MTTHTHGTAFWRSAFGREEVIQRVRPEHTNEYLNNPHKGTTTFQRFNGDALYSGLRWSDSAGPLEFPPPVCVDLSNPQYPPTRVSYCRWAWSTLEPRKGEFRFDIIDRALETAATRGQTLQLRTQPFVGELSCPEWFWDTGARVDPEVEPRSKRIPDHNDPLYIEHWSDHIRALGERYDGHPTVESFDIAYGGGCGETGGNATCITSRRLAQVYLDSFPDTQLVAMLGTEGCAYAAKCAPFPVGWRADCFGDVSSDGLGVVPDGLRWNHMRDAYPREVNDNGVVDSWQRAPVTFETCWTVPHWNNEGWDIDWILEQGLKYHPSIFMPKSVFIPDVWIDRIMAFSQRLGYWFHLHQMVLPLEAKPGSRIGVAFTMDNKGVAPIYRPYRFALRFSQGRAHHIVKLACDICKWLPDLSFVAESVAFPAGLVRGEARVSCSIVDMNDRPVVRLAIRAIDADGWHPLTSIDVLD